jgi:hypothetical protein
MKMWRSLYREPANRCRESCLLWSSFPVADVSKIFLEKLQFFFPLTLPQVWVIFIILQVKFS